MKRYVNCVDQILNSNDYQESLVQFVSIVSGSLAQELRDSKTETRKYFEEEVKKMAKSDPEFILKVFILYQIIVYIIFYYVLKLALYCRLDLNLRLISNLLLALSAQYPETRYFLKKYFSTAIRLPSDWLMVANLCKTVDSDLTIGSLPTALRKAMKEKFLQFDEYQLAKYNKALKGPKVMVIELYTYYILC